MKKLLFALFAMAVVIGCSKNDDAPSPQEANGQASFLTVNFKSAGSITKAPEEMFEYGSTDENAVNNVVFYFFDENGEYIKNYYFNPFDTNSSRMANPLYDATLSSFSKNQTMSMTNSLSAKWNMTKYFYITGQEPGGCTHNCSTCGGCH